MKPTAYHQVGQDWVATDSLGRVVGVLKSIPIIHPTITERASKGPLERLNELPSSNLIKLKSGIHPAS